MNSGKGTKGKESSKKFIEKKSSCGKVRGRAQRERITSLGSLSPLQGCSFTGLFLPSGHSSCFVPTLVNLSQDPPSGVHAPLSQDGSWNEGCWEERDSSWPGIIPRLLAHMESFCTWKGEKGRSLNPFLSFLFFFFPFRPCHDYYLEMFTRNNNCLFVNRRLIVNSSAGAHLPFLSGNANRRLSRKCPAWSLSIYHLTGRPSSAQHFLSCDLVSLWPKQSQSSKISNKIEIIITVLSAGICDLWVLWLGLSCLAKGGSL